ncbi:MAG TPA: transglycosylase SLT domain-containing protein, partial [Usitatibacter sp.]
MILKRKRGAFALLLALSTSAAFSSSPPPAVPQPSLPSAFEDVDDVPLPDPDLWQRIRLGFRLDALDSPLVADQEAWYASRPEYIKRFVDRGSLYLHYIVEQVEKRGMPTEIALLPVVESAFNPKAYSRSKASGIWQFIPSTGKNYGLAQDWWKDNRRDIVAATDAALNYLQKLHDDFNSWELALAAYNCGEGCVARAIAYNQKHGLATDYSSLVKLPPETRSYVPKLFAVKNIVLSPASYGIELDSVPDVPYFTEVKAPGKIDVKVAAKLADMTEEDFTALNPAHNKAVASSGTLILPVDRADAFRTNLESYDKPLVSWTTYPAKRGESLDAIAKHNNLSLAEIKAANGDMKF